jgi:colanic acid/amylovoran biosynthesis protein
MSVIRPVDTLPLYEPAPGLPRRPLHVALLSHAVGSDNFGVGALSLANVAILRDVAARSGVSCRFVFLGREDDRPPYVVGDDVEVRPVRWRHLLTARENHFTAIKACALACDIGGGDSFTDLYGLKRFGFQSALKLFALAARRPLILSPQTIGPFRRGPTRRLAAAILERCRAVVVRDRLSLDFVREIAPACAVIEATDVAFRLPYVPQALPKTAPLAVGINVSGLLFNGGYTRDNMFQLSVDYPRLVRSLIGRFQALGDAEVHLISHVISASFAVEDDYRVAAALAAEFPGTTLAPRFTDPIAAKSYISGLDFFCGARMHACIAAFSAGVPVVPVAYSRKFTGLFQSLGYGAIADGRAQTTEEAIATVMAGFADRDRLRQQIGEGNRIAAAKLAAYEAVLGDVLSEVAGCQG